MSGNNKQSLKVLLISMPFAPMMLPSPQLGTLEAYLAENGVAVDSLHLYLKCADHLGVELYHLLTSGTALAYILRESVYTSFMFPDHFERNKTRIEQIIEQAEADYRKFPLMGIVEHLDRFNQDIIDDIKWQDYDLIGFSINFSQLLPSLFIARAIKSRHPQLKIVFGGFRVMEQLGIGVMETFPYIDYVISGEGEKSLVKLIRALSNGQFEGVAGLVYRKNHKIAFNDWIEPLDINSLPFCQFDSYFEQLKNCREDTRMQCETNLLIPIQSSRGCWWGKCNFCNIRLAHKTYREKTTERVVEEIKFQSEKYQLISVYFMDEALRPKKAGELFDAIKNLGKDFIIALLGRANNFTKEEIKKMYDAGVASYQVGIEAFSTNLLSKMEKGTKTIQNIEVIKNCLEMGIHVLYTLMHSFPYQDKKDLEETLHTLQYLDGFPPPSNAFHFELQYGSPTLKNHKELNIDSVHPSELEGLIYPPEIVKAIALRYDYTKIKNEDLPTRELSSAIEEWMNKSQKRWKESMGMPSLFYNRGGNFLTIYDLRQPKKSKFILSELEGRIYLFCDKIRSLEQILEEFKEVPKDDILQMLKMFEEHKLTFSEDNEYLSLAVKYHPYRDLSENSQQKDKPLSEIRSNSL